MVNFGEINSSTQIQRTYTFTVNNFRKGATAPADVDIGTTPTVRALRFSATNELLSFDFVLPNEMVPGANVSLSLHFALVDTETDGDALDFTFDYITVQENNNELFTKTSTQTAGQVTVTTANGLDPATCYEMNIVLDGADADNPLNPNDTLCIEMHMTNTTGVARADLVSSHIVYQSTI